MGVGESSKIHLQHSQPRNDVPKARKHWHLGIRRCRNSRGPDASLVSSSIAAHIRMGFSCRAGREGCCLQTVFPSRVQ
jgi:hypothetical protein